MGKSGRNVLILIFGGILYAFFKLGDELVLFLDELGGLKWDFDILLIDVPENTTLTLETIVLALVAIFFVFAITDYVTSNRN